MYNSCELTDDIIERLILQKIISDKSYMILMSEVFDKRWFNDDNIKVCVALAVSYYAKYEKLPSTGTIKLLLEKLLLRKPELDISIISQTLTECVSTLYDIDDKCIEDNVIEYMKSRGSYFAISDNLKDIEVNCDASKCIERLLKFEGLLLSEDIGLNYFSDQDTHWEKLLNPEAKLSFGITELDKVTNGGVLSDGRNLIVFMAQPGLGKSLTLSNLTHNFAKMNKVIVIISLELSQDVYGKRIDSHISGDNIDKLTESHEMSREKIEKFRQEYPDATIIIKEFPPNSITGASIELFMDRLINSGINPDVLIIDYLNLILPKRKTNEGMYSDIGNVSRELRAMSYKYNIPVFTATQSNADGYNSDKIGLENVSESKGIAHTADFILALYQLDEDRDAGIINGVVLKNRLGGYIGKRIPFKVDPFNLRMSGYSDTGKSDDISDLLSDTEELPMVGKEVEVEFDIHKM